MPRIKALFVFILSVGAFGYGIDAEHYVVTAASAMLMGAALAVIFGASSQGAAS